MAEPPPQRSSARTPRTPGPAAAGSGTPAASSSGTRSRPRHPPRPATSCRAPSRARSTQYTVTVISSASSASGLLKRNISAATGVTREHRARDQARRRALKRRRTAAYSTPTVATPISTSGTRICQEPSPKSRTDRAIGQSAAGGLSTVMEFAASERAEEEGLPALAAGLHGGGVEGVGVAGRAEVLEVEQRGDQQQAEEGGPHPAGRPRRARARAGVSGAGRGRAAGARVRAAAGPSCGRVVVIGRSSRRTEGRVASARRSRPSAGRRPSAGSSSRRSGKTQARKSRNRSTVAARLAAIRTASSVPCDGVAGGRVQGGERAAGQREADAEDDQALRLVAYGAGPGRVRRR